MLDNLEVQTIYERRFTPDVVFRRQMWDILCHDFFQRYVPKNSTVLEVAAGYCEFINNIKAERKIAVDINPHTKEYANKEVEVVITTSTDLSMLPESSIDIVFCSNFFEHLTKPDIVTTIQQIWRVLKKGGQFLILQPNIRYCSRQYWMFFDHITPLDEHSLAEALETNKFEVKHTIVRFMPFTVKGRLPKSLFLVKAYLKLPLAWKFFGQQSFMIAQVQK